MKSKALLLITSLCLVSLSSSAELEGDWTLKDESTTYGQGPFDVGVSCDGPGCAGSLGFKLELCGNTDTRHSVPNSDDSSFSASTVFGDSYVPSDFACGNLKRDLNTMKLSIDTDGDGEYEGSIKNGLKISSYGGIKDYFGKYLYVWMDSPGSSKELKGFYISNEKSTSPSGDDEPGTADINGDNSGSRPPVGGVGIEGKTSGGAGYVSAGGKDDFADQIVQQGIGESLEEKLDVTTDRGFAWNVETANARSKFRDDFQSSSATPAHLDSAYAIDNELVTGQASANNPLSKGTEGWFRCGGSMDGATVFNYTSGSSYSETGKEWAVRCDTTSETNEWRTSIPGTWEPVTKCSDGIDNDDDGDIDAEGTGSSSTDDGCVSPDDTREEGECEGDVTNQVFYYPDWSGPPDGFYESGSLGDRIKNEVEGDSDPYSDDVAVWYTENSGGNCQGHFEVGDQYEETGGSSTSFSGTDKFKGSYGFVPPRDTSWYPGAPIPDKAKKVDCSTIESGPGPIERDTTQKLDGYHARGEWYSSGAEITVDCGGNDNAYAAFNGSLTGNVASLEEGFKREANEDAEGVHVHRLTDARQEFNGVNEEVCGENSKGIPVNEEGITGQNCYYDPSPPQGWKALNQDENPIQPETKGYGQVEYPDLENEEVQYSNSVDIFFQTNFTTPTYESGAETAREANWDGGWVPQCPPTYQLSFDTDLEIWKCTNDGESVPLSVEKASIVNADSGETYGGLRISASDFSSAWQQLTGSNPFDRPGYIKVDTVCHRGNPSDYDNAATNSNTVHMIKTMERSVEEIKMVTGDLPELESRPGAAGYSCRFAFLKNYSNTDTAYAIEGLDRDGRLETNVPGSFEFDVSSNSPPVGNDEDGYSSDSNARLARKRYKDTGQNAFRIDCEDVDGKYKDICESVVRS